MKVKFIREVAAFASADHPDLFERDGRRWFPVGAIMEDPRAVNHVILGNAVPADEECEIAANMTPEKMKTAQAAQEMALKGIEPEDRQRYRNGEILGYDEDGNDIPGPNWIEPDDTDDD